MRFVYQGLLSKLEMCGGIYGVFHRLQLVCAMSGRHSSAAPPLPFWELKKRAGSETLGTKNNPRPGGAHVLGKAGELPCRDSREQNKWKGKENCGEWHQ